MTNRIAIWLGIVLLAAIALNHALGFEAHVYLGRKFLDLVSSIAFWR